jgi:hypothetical protein
MRMCLHQWIKPNSPYVEVPGVGKCEECLPDEENNKNCLRYCPVSVCSFKTEDGNAESE